MFTPSVHANGFVNVKMYYIYVGQQFHQSIYLSETKGSIKIMKTRLGVSNWRNIAVFQLAFQPLKCKINVENVWT